MNKYELYFMTAQHPFTFGELCAILNNGEPDRLADRTIQKWRRKGWLKYTRVGSRIEWVVTDKGFHEAGGLV